MEEFRRHALYCPRGRPPSVRRLDVAFDYGAFPVWAWGVIPARGGHPGREVVGMARPEGLGLSAELSSGLQAWSDWKDLHSEYGGGRVASEEQHRAWSEQGRELTRRLSEETGAEVVYQWDRGDANPECPHCGHRG
jgi:hypothetical protein